MSYINRPQIETRLDSLHVSRAALMHSERNEAENLPDKDLKLPIVKF